MATILEPGFETVDNWTYSETDTNGILSGTRGTGWKTEGTYSYYLLANGTSANGDFNQIKQTINIPSNFSFIVDIRKDGTLTAGYRKLQVLIDTTVVWEIDFSNATNLFTDQLINLSSYTGSHDLIFKILHVTGVYSSGTNAQFDNIRERLTDVYVDINKADDTGNGVAFATAKKTMKAGWDILTSTGTMHVATGDYSAQTTITYDKSWSLSPEDPNSTGIKSVSIPKST